MLWVLDLMADVCTDMHRFHRIADASKLTAGAFSAIARRLPYYDGAVTRAMADYAERRKDDGRVLSLAELAGRSDLAGRDGFAPVFEVQQRGGQPQAG